MVGIGAFRVYMRTRLNIEPYLFSLGLTLKSSRRSCSCRNHVTQAVVRVGSKIGSYKVGFKELRHEPKFLNRGLCFFSITPRVTSIDRILKQLKIAHASMKRERFKRYPCESDTPLEITSTVPVRMRRTTHIMILVVGVCYADEYWSEDYDSGTLPLVDNKGNDLN